MRCLSFCTAILSTVAIALSTYMCPLFLCALPAGAVDERPVNFIFLIDVSGSMLYKSEMVKAADGSQVTLFEALRQALEQIVQDTRLIGSKSRISFITFGTKITEKTSWPPQIATPQDRQGLLAKIQSADELSADKHGDTYMGGALSLALQKANQMYSDTDPCTTTFIVMLTDGWDEPPAGATVKVKAVAAQLLAKQHEMLSKLGVKTWQVLVIGLQTLPDRKAGTTTARELAGMLGGGFIDVTKQAGGTVSERIFLSLKQQVEALKGQLSVAKSSPSGRSSVKNGILDFGTVDGNGAAQAVMPLELKSCYAEEITAITDISATLPEPKAHAMMASVPAEDKSACQLCSTLPAQAITLKLPQATTEVAPQSAQEGERKGTIQDVPLTVQAHSTCPAGEFLGFFRLTSSAKVPDFIPYIVKVPGRIVAEPEEIKVKVKKPGMFFSEPCSVDLIGSLKQPPGTHAKASYNVVVTAESPVMTSGSSKKDATVESRIDATNINHGKPYTFTLDTAKVDRENFTLTVDIPANQKPGRYEGKLALKVDGPSQTSAPNEIPYQVAVDPSAWEEVAPVAVPLLIILIIVSAFGLFLWVSNMRRE